MRSGSVVMMVVLVVLVVLVTGPISGGIARAAPLLGATYAFAPSTPGGPTATLEFARPPAAVGDVSWGPLVSASDVTDNTFVGMFQDLGFAAGQTATMLALSVPSPIVSAGGGAFTSGEVRFLAPPNATDRGGVTFVDAVLGPEPAIVLEFTGGAQSQVITGSWSFAFATQILTVPAPAGVVLLGSGLAGVAWAARRRARRGLPHAA